VPTTSLAIRQPPDGEDLNALEADRSISGLWPAALDPTRRRASGELARLAVANRGVRCPCGSSWPARR
jgi:hypothetical protein